MSLLLLVVSAGSHSASRLCLCDFWLWAIHFPLSLTCGNPLNLSWRRVPPKMILICFCQSPGDDNDLGPFKLSAWVFWTTEVVWIQTMHPRGSWLVGMDSWRFKKFSCIQYQDEGKYVSIPSSTTWQISLSTLYFVHSPLKSQPSWRIS